MAQEEQVLVIPRKVFDRLGAFNGLMFDVERYLNEIFSQGAPFFMLRRDAEKKPEYKQLIPYVIMKYEDKVLSYIRGRRAGESRLTGLRSIGIGGHINPGDDLPLFNANFFDTYLAAVQREVAEEVVVSSAYANRIAALLNDDGNDVGAVHLGIVHCWRLQSANVEKREQMITQMEFMTVPRLIQIRDTMETWSQICLNEISKI